MNIPDILAKLVGVTDRLENMAAANAGLVDDLKAKDEQIVDLKNALESAPKADYVAGLLSSIEKLEAENKTLSEANANLQNEAAVTSFKVNQEAAMIVAASAGAPATISNKEEENPLANLKGLAKVHAAFKLKQNK